jgi:tripartite-type tricarboxylate transporter receptor subunit TctC
MTNLKFPRRNFLHLAAGAATLTVLVALANHGAWSQASRTIKIVVPFSPGGTTDILARILGEQIGRTQRVTVLIENRPGAGAVIGTEAVSRATPDGNTILMTANSFVINPNLKKLNYDPLTSFEPICYLVRSPHVIIVNGASPNRTLGDLLGAARAKPGSLTMAANGPATAHHIAFEMLKRAASVNMIFVPYPGTAPAVNALLGEHVSSAITDLADVAEHLKAGKLRALATASRDRIEPLPDVPTIAEAGFKDYEAEGTLGVVAPAKTPKETASQLANWFTAAMQVSEVKAKLVAQGLHPIGTCGPDFGTLLRKQYDEYGRVIREANIKAE